MYIRMYVCIHTHTYTHTHMRGPLESRSLCPFSRQSSSFLLSVTRLAFQCSLFPLVVGSPLVIFLLISLMLASSMSLLHLSCLLVCSPDSTVHCHVCLDLCSLAHSLTQLRLLLPSSGLSDSPLVTGLLTCPAQLASTLLASLLALFTLFFFSFVPLTAHAVLSSTQWSGNRKSW